MLRTLGWKPGASLKGECGLPNKGPGSSVSVPYEMWESQGVRRLKPAAVAPLDSPTPHRVRPVKKPGPAKRRRKYVGIFDAGISMNTAPRLFIIGCVRKMSRCPPETAAIPAEPGYP